MLDLPVRRTVDAVREALQTAIRRGELKPGDALSVPELARRLNVSRSPVREAVLHLVADGFAVEAPRRGVALRTLDERDLAQIHEMREVLEGLAARRCAAAPPPGLLDALEALLARERDAVKRLDAAGYADTNARFHAAIARASGNDRLTDSLTRLANQMALALADNAASPAVMTKGHAEHRAVLRAIAAGKPEAAELAMRGHIARNREDMRTLHHA
jgi:DNA-binding GntR family transcriptional regulator